MSGVNGGNQEVRGRRNSYRDGRKEYEETEMISSCGVKEKGTYENGKILEADKETIFKCLCYCESCTVSLLNIHIYGHESNRYSAKCLSSLFVILKHFLGF
jgi:hypothetical protein